MKTALDTNILSALWTRELVSRRVATELGVAKSQGAVVISPVVYAELLAHPLYTEVQVNDFLARTGIRIDLPLMDDVWTEAGRRFAQYAVRRRQSEADAPRRLLADFLVGAHALYQVDRLMTLDESHFSRYFPEVPLYRMKE
jgi:predicted nucleic acid-binding protein